MVAEGLRLTTLVLTLAVGLRNICLATSIALAVSPYNKPLVSLFATLEELLGAID